MYKPGKQKEKLNMLTKISQDIFKKIKNLRQQYQFQILLQNNQLDKDVKKILAVMFCASNANVGKDIVYVNNYLNKRNLAQNKIFAK